jgi:hypothetical protein
MNLADKPEHQSVIASLAKHLPPVAATVSDGAVSREPFAL